MASVSDEETVDYAGPPLDPPPTRSERVGSSEYEPPPRPAAWIEKSDDSAIIQEKGDTQDYETLFTSKKEDHTSREQGETDQEEDDPDRDRPPSGGSEAPSGAIPLLHDDVTGVFRRMATIEEWEERQILLADACTPPGSGAAVLAMGSSLLHWKRLLGLAAPGGWTQEYHMPSDLPDGQPQPPMACKLLTAAWVLAGVVLMIVSIGLQWAFCQREYYVRLQAWPVGSSNSSAREYLCVPSFTWTFLVPRLLFIFGYVTIFACIFCLRLPDFEFVIARAYDVITEDRQNASITSQFIAYCRRDPWVIAVWFVVIHALSLAGSLLGEDIVKWNLTEAKPPPSSGLEWATYITTCLVRLMTDSMIGHCLISSSLSVKYLELMVDRVTWYLQTLVTIRRNPTSCQYFFTRIGTVERCVRRAQPYTSAALLMAMLRICQVTSLVWVDQSGEPRRHSSLAQLPIAVVFFLIVFHHIRRHISLTETWRLRLEKGPDIRIFPEPPLEDPLHTEREFSETEEVNRATVLWHHIVRRCPQVAGRVMGMQAAHWMYWAVLVVGTLYCSGYYALLKHTPLI